MEWLFCIFALDLIGIVIVWYGQWFAYIVEEQFAQVLFAWMANCFWLAMEFLIREEYLEQERHFVVITFY